MRKLLATLGFVCVGTGWAVGGSNDSKVPATQGTVNQASYTQAEGAEQPVILTGLIAKRPADAGNQVATPVSNPLPETAQAAPAAPVQAAPAAAAPTVALSTNSPTSTALGIAGG